jgi:hypothetical protein
MPRITFTKPIKPGFRRKFTLTPDEPVDELEGGGFAVGAVVEGDSSAPTINDTSTEKKITGWVNGDGALGDKVVSVQVDAHVNEGVVPLVVEIAYSVAHKDATELKVDEGAVADDEEIPTAGE